MTRMTLASASLAMLISAGTALAQTTPPPVQTPPPATPTQTPPPALPTPPGAQAAPRPAPVPFPADSKIGFVNLQAVVSESKLGKQGSDQLKALSDRLDGELTTLQKKITDLEKEIQTQQAVLSPASLKAKQTQGEELARQFQFQQSERNAKVQKLQEDLLGNFEEKVVPIVDALRTEKSLHVIFAVQGQSQGGLAVMSYHPGIDLTAEVIKRLDAATPVAPKAIK